MAHKNARGSSRNGTPLAPIMPRTRRDSPARPVRPVCELWMFPLNFPAGGIWPMIRRRVGTWNGCGGCSMIPCRGTRLTADALAAR